MIKSPRTKGVFVIAEVAQAHDGSLGILHSLVRAVAKTGVDAIKFQVHLADAESSSMEPFRKKFSIVDKDRKSYWKRMELSLDQWSRLKNECKSLGVEFLATPFSNAAVDLCEKIGVVRYKVGSGDANNLLLLEKISRTKKQILLSTGLVGPSELDRSVRFLRQKKVPFVLLHCTSQYPAPHDQIGLDGLAKLRARYRCSVGFSDHSASIFPSIGAVALGAKIVETHVCFDRRMFGPDATSSLTINEFQEMVRGIRIIEKALGVNNLTKKNQAKDQLKKILVRSLVINRSVSPGHRIAFEDLEAAKMAGGEFAASEYTSVIGRKLRRAKCCGEKLRKRDLLAGEKYACW